MTEFKRGSSHPRFYRTREWFSGGTNYTEDPGGLLALELAWPLGFKQKDSVPLSDAARRERNLRLNSGMNKYLTEVEQQVLKTRLGYDSGYLPSWDEVARKFGYKNGAQAGKDYQRIIRKLKRGEYWFPDRRAEFEDLHRFIPFHKEHLAGYAGFTCNYDTEIFLDPSDPNRVRVRIKRGDLGLSPPSIIELIEGEPGDKDWYADFLGGFLSDEELDSLLRLRRKNVSSGCWGGIISAFSRLREQHIRPSH